MIELRIFISGGDEIEELREVAMKALRMLEQTFATEMNASLFLRNWDFRLGPPTVVPAGQIAAKSLTMVERSHALVAILGETVPDITGKEILRAFELRAAGAPVDVWVFLLRGAQNEENGHLFEKIRQIASEDVVYSQYDDALEFQGALMMTLIPFLLERVETADGPLFGGS